MRQMETAKSKFTQGLEALKSIVTSCNIAGEWRALADGQHQFRTPGGTVLNWWPNGTLLFQGSAGAKPALEAAINNAITGTIPPPAPLVRTTQASKSIFVVHGHDDVAREQLELVLHKLGLQPFVLQNSAGGGKTIIESLERQIGLSPEAEFGIVLMTPDDMGYSKRAGEKEIKARARQNVILEMGMLLSSLTRARVAILVKGFVEPPSDVDGIIYIHFNDHVKEVVPKLAERLQQCGIIIDAAKISYAAS